MNERLLPIGTIVKLKKAKRNVMITSYFIFSVKGENHDIYDYGGCPYPLGIVDANTAFAFNHDEIEEVVFLGYIDDDEKQLVKELLATETQMKKDIKEKLSKKDKKEA